MISWFTLALLMSQSSQSGVAVLAGSSQSQQAADLHDPSIEDAIPLIF